MSILKILKQNKGQSIIETLVAIAVIVVGLVGIITLVVSSVSAGRISKEVTTATNLAREGIEVVREMRDSNWSEEEVWNEGIVIGQEAQYMRAEFSPKDNQWDLKNIGTTDLFSDSYQLNFSNYYNHNGEGEDSGFFRMIIVQENLAEADEFLVTVKIGWKEKDKAKEITMQDVLTNWLSDKEVE